MNPDVFFENFELLADAPNGVQKLREFILQLAVMGKLVPQDLNGEPISSISKEIEVTKTRLIKERVLKSNKISEKKEISEMKYEIPENWKWYRLGDVVFFQEGPGSRNWQFKTHGIKLLNVKNILSNGDLLLENSDKFVSEEEFNEKYKHFLIEEGDLLFASSGGSWGKSAWFKNPGYKVMMNTSTIRLRFYSEKFEPNYLKHYLDSSFFRNQMEPQLVGMQPNFGSTHLSRIYIPIPPLAEQKHIVSKVDELMALCDKLEARRQKKQEIQSKLNSAALDRILSAENQEEFEQHWQRICENFDLLYDDPENVEKLRQAIFQLAVQGKLVPQNPEDEPASVLIKKIEADIKKIVDNGNLKKLASVNSDNISFKLPNSWKWIQLGKLLTFGPKNGYSPKPVDFVTNTRSLTLSATTSGKFRDDCFKYIDEKIDKDSHLWLEENDILIQRGNSIEYVGIAAVYKGPSHNFIYPDLMMKLRVHQSVNTDFLHISLNNRFSRDYFAEKASGTSGSMPKINQNTVISLPIPLPPIEEQKRIVEKIEQLMGLCDGLESKLRKSREDSEKLTEAFIKGLLEGAATEKPELDKLIPLQAAAIKLK